MDEESLPLKLFMWVGNHAGFFLADVHWKIIWYQTAVIPNAKEHTMLKQKQ